MKDSALAHQLKEMFTEMVLKKQASKISHYYHADFLLYTNGTTMNYAEFLKSHQEYYATPIQYQIEYDEETFLENGDKLAGRIWITVKKPNQGPRKIEVVLIAQYKDHKLYRLWELTYPDWSQLPAFKNA
jgi:hypothetical protein